METLREEENRKEIDLIIEIGEGGRQNAMRNKLFVGFFIVFAFLTSCNEGEVYYRFQPVKNSHWNKQTAFDFLFDSFSVDSNEQYDVTLEIINNNQYPYQNIWLFVQQNITDTAFITDTIEIRLADSHGKWIGKGTAGLYQLSVPYKTSVALDSTRAYLIRIRQGMKDNSLKGIEKVGVLVKSK